MSEPEPDYVQMALQMRQMAHSMVLDGKCREEWVRVALELIAAASDLAMGNLNDQVKLFREAEKFGVHIQRPHFYSPTPTIGELDDEIWCSNDKGIKWNEPASAHLLQELSPFAGEFCKIVESGRWDPHNPAFAHSDASTYYCMVRHLRPKRIVEVGGGYSTQLAALAVEANGTGQITCIEPHPSDLLERLDVHLIKSRVQDVDMGEFDLGKGDVLFIDSSHVSKIGSDINHLFFDVLPQVARGVYVHFHDIFLPHEYPAEWIKDRLLFWNEQYLLRAFLMGNSEWSVQLPVHRLAETRPDLIQKACPSPTVVGGGSFWIRREDA